VLNVLSGVVVFTIIIMVLVAVILCARSTLVATGDVTVFVNEQREITAPAGRKLLSLLADAGLYLASACGGRGTCGQCRVTVVDGDAVILPIEEAHITRRQALAGERLACQVAVKQNIRVRLPDDVFGARKMVCTVKSNRNVATFIRELILELPDDERLDFQAGGYVQLECPPHDLKFEDFDIEPEFHDEWERFKLWDFHSSALSTEVRAYSMANYPDEDQIIMLNVRLATPPPALWDRVPPGVMSSYLFSLLPGNEISVTGPFGDFFAKETDKEMVFIGGGAGMAPMRSHIFDQLKRIGSQRKIEFWYGARSRRELFYVDEFNELQAEHSNFRLHVALSEPSPDDQWDGHVGFIHQVLHDEYLSRHPYPEDCEYYICGPPMMISAVVEMLEYLGVHERDVMFDDFGG